MKTAWSCKKKRSRTTNNRVCLGLVRRYRFPSRYIVMEGCTGRAPRIILLADTMLLRRLWFDVNPRHDSAVWVLWRRARRPASTRTSNRCTPSCTCVITTTSAMGPVSTTFSLSFRIYPGHKILQELAPLSRHLSPPFDFFRRVDVLGLLLFWR